MKVSIDIDEDLMRRARRLTGLRTKREVVQRALQTLVQLKEQERIRRYRGKLPSGRRRPGAEIRKLRRADPKLSPQQVLKPRQRVVGPNEARVRAERLIKTNRELFRRLAAGPASSPPRAKKG